MSAVAAIAPLAASFPRSAVAGRRVRGVRSARCQRVVARAAAGGEGVNGRKTAALAAIAVRAFVVWCTDVHTLYRCCSPRSTRLHVSQAVGTFFFSLPKVYAILLPPVRTTTGCSGCSLRAGERRRGFRARCARVKGDAANE
jgi:hypothetical protein